MHQAFETVFLCVAEALLVTLFVLSFVGAQINGLSIQWKTAFMR